MYDDLLTDFFNDDDIAEIDDDDMANENAPKTVVVNGRTIKIASAPKEPQGNHALYSKDTRKNLDHDSRMSFTRLIESNQQTPFKIVNTSINDPDKVKSIFSLRTQLEDCQRNLQKYALLEVFTVVYPLDKAFDATNPNYGQVKTNGTDLFKHYRTVTPTDVAESSRWYATFSHEDTIFQDDLNLSLHYFQKNVSPDLYHRVRTDLKSYDEVTRGGPLFLKLLLDKLTTNTESTLQNFLQLIKGYEIKGNDSNPTENIDKVVEEFRGILEAVLALKDGQAPEDLVLNLLRIFQTTSIPPFNQHFTDFAHLYSRTAIQRSINPNYDMIHGAQGLVLRNDEATATFVLTFAEKAYREAVNKGEWDECLQRPPGKSAFIQHPPSPSHPLPISGPSPLPQRNKDACWNCGSFEHRLSDCPHPRDDAKIRTSKLKHHKYRFARPLSGEPLVRYINGKTYHWNPNGGARNTGHWDLQATPSTGEVNGGAPPNVPPSISAPPPQVHHQQQAPDDMSVLTNQLTTTTDHTERLILLNLITQRAEAMKNL